MGRELFRVPMDFDWPWAGEEKTSGYGGGVWPGFMFGHSDDCLYDDQEGYSCGKRWHEAIPPPVGEGFQLWETTTEGSPISPVFASLEELCDWAESNATTFGHYKTSSTEWRRMLSEGLVMTEIGPGMIAL